MAYAIDVAKILADTLAKFSTLNPGQLAGHVANLEFWVLEINHGTSLIDGYHKRFEAMKAAQQPKVRAVDLKSVPDSQLKQARNDLIDAAYKFLLRCYKTNLLDEKSLRTILASIGTTLEPQDI